MSEHTSTSGNGTQAAVQRRKASGKPRKSPEAKPVYFVLQVMDADGTPLPINKRNVKVLALARSSDRVLELIDSGEHENAFYLRSMLPPGR